ncbi:MAG: phage baseplate assembly protein V [Bacteroidota bacterium]
MEGIIDIMQKVAEREAQKIYTNELGVVTAVFPHESDSDDGNYECTVRLKNRKQPDGSDFELRKVPVMTGHIGQVNIPNLNDLVLVTFIGGDINAPVIIGRLYNDEDRPPVNTSGEYILQHSLEKGGSLKLDAAGVVTISGQEEKSIVTVNDDEITLTTGNGQVTITLGGSGIVIDAGSNDITLKSMGNVTLGDAATGQVKVGGRMLANAVGDNDDIILSTHTHLGNLGAPCPILVPTEKINSIQAKGRNTQVG